MADNPAEMANQIRALEQQMGGLNTASEKLAKEFQKLGVTQEGVKNQMGLWEKTTAKMKNSLGVAFTGAVLKTRTTLKNLTKGIVETDGASKEQRKNIIQGMPAFTQLIIKWTQGTKIQKRMAERVAGGSKLFADQSKLVNKLGMRMVKLGAAVGGLFGFLIVAGIGLTMFSVALDGANSPLLTMTENVGFLHDAVQGLILAITGEGEGTFMDVLIAAIVVSLPLWFLLNSTIAAVAFSAIIAGGAFHLLQDAGVGVETATVALIAIFVALTLTLLNLGAVVAAMTGGVITSVGAAVAVIVAGVSFIIGGIALVVAGINTGVTWWKSILMIVLGAFLIFIGVLILTASLPVAAVVAVTIAIIALVVRFWDEIEAIVKGFFMGMRILFKGAWDGIVAFAGIIITVVLGALIGFASIILGVIGGIVLGIFGALKNLWNSFWTKVIEGKGGIMAFILGIPRDIAVGFLTGFGRAFNAITGIYNKFARKMKFDIPSWVPIVGGKEFKLPEIAPIALAKGGIVKTPTHALIGEAGPEAVIPLNRMKEMGGMGSTVNVNIDVSGVTDRSDKRALAREISDLVAQEMRRMGGGPTRGRF